MGSDGALVEPTKERFYRPELDALRFFAFIAVFLHHTLPQAEAGWIYLGAPHPLARLLAGIARAGGFGVTLFFALSAYLITELLLREHTQCGRLDIRAFYIRRALRIWPLYFVFLAAAVLCARWLPGEALSRWYLGCDLVFLGNWVVALRGYPTSVTAPLWSISVEEQFYIAWPLLLALVSVARLRSLCISFLAVAVASRLLLTVMQAHHPAFWCNTFAQLDPIALGALLAYGLRSGVPRLTPGRRVLVALAGLATLVGCGTFLPLDGWVANLTFPAISVASVALLASTLGLSAIARPTLVYLGRISYGLYIVHLACIELVSKFLPHGMTRLVASLAVTIALASVLYQLVEKPFMRIKRRFTKVASRDS